MKKFRFSQNDYDFFLFFGAIYSHLLNTTTPKPLNMREKMRLYGRKKQTCQEACLLDGFKICMMRVSPRFPPPSYGYVKRVSWVSHQLPLFSLLQVLGR